MRYDFCLLLCRPISSVGLNTGSVRPIGYANTGFVSPYLARWAQYGLRAPYWLRQYGLCVALLPSGNTRSCVALSHPLGSIRAPF